MHVMTGLEAATTRRTDQSPPVDPPTPLPTTATVTIGTNLRTVDTRLGWTSVQNQSRGATTKAILDSAATIQNQFLVGFGAAVDPQPGAGAGYDWTFLDATYGLTSAAGYFSVADERCLTACGCPPHMRVPKGTLPPDPQGPVSGSSLTSLSDFTPPHSSWFQDYANLIAAAIARYPHIKYLQVWSRMRGFSFVTQYPGSNLVPTGSGLPARTGTDRVWTEGYTAMYNLIWSAVKAVRSDAVISGPYDTMTGYSWTNQADWADDAFPDLLMRNTGTGAWGYADKKVLASLRYFIQNCRGADMLCMHIRNNTSDSTVTGYYNPTSVPAATDPTNIWLTNPDAGVDPRYYIEGANPGAWNAGQKLVDFSKWVRDLGASNTVYQRAACDARTIPIAYAEWYAFAPYNGMYPNPATGDYYTGIPLATHREWAAAFAWHYIYALEAGAYYCLAWKPEGTVGDDGSVLNDSGESDPLGLWHQLGSTLSLQPTELATVCEQLILTFPVGAQLKTVTSNTEYLRGAATATQLLLVSRSPSPLDVSVDGKTITLTGFETRLVDRVAPTNPSGFVMPIADPPGMTRIFQEDFTTYGDIPLGSFPANTNGRWGGAPNSWIDTSGAGQYNMGKTCSVTNGVLNIHLWCEMVAGVKKIYSSAPWPILNNNTDNGIIDGYDYTASPPANRANLYYGQVEFAFRASYALGWKTAWLFWPDRGTNKVDAFGVPGGNGEIDFPEGDLNGVSTIRAYMHRQDATIGGDQAAFNSNVVYANNVWHHGRLVWKPTVCEFWLDGIKFGSATTRIPATPMHWVFQCEVNLGTDPDPAIDSSGDVQLDWCVFWQLDGF